MSWPCTFTSLAIAVLLAAGASSAAAQNLESAIMPGPVSRAHVKQEPDCSNCHVRFNRSGQPQRCLDCHKEVAGDVRARTGFHGRLKELQCNLCHTEHKGRDANIVVLDEKAFDHTQTDFQLRGKHQQVRCASCHSPKTKHRDTPSTCVGCHRKDDPHKGELGAKCETCHSESAWKEARFDHSKTRFALEHRHAELKCAACHIDKRFVNTPRECFGCHKKDDAHKGRFGQRCASCHTPEKWKAPSFNHDRDTHFKLRDRHRSVKCDSCHLDVSVRPRTPNTCNACHRKDDPHKGALGDKCEGCHTERGWKQAAGFDHERTRFALRGLHREAKCEGCHKDQRFRDTPSACFACHERDDLQKGHKGRFGERCETCHVERGWKPPIFDHARDTRYPLHGKHRELKCDSCHQGFLYKDRLDSQCFACHAKDDYHKERLGPDCGKCHTPAGWKGAQFDHARTGFELLGKHAKIACVSCHRGPMNGPISMQTNCYSCHSKDDIHFLTNGPQCETCHMPEDWERLINPELRKKPPAKAPPPRRFFQ